MPAGDVFRFPGSSIATRKRKSTEVCCAIKRITGRKQEFAAPDRAVRTEACSIPRDSQSRCVDSVFGHARHDMRPMMLDSLRLAGRVWRRWKIRMKITGDHNGPNVIQMLQIIHRSMEGTRCFFCFEISDVLADYDGMPLSAGTARATVFFKCEPAASVGGSTSFTVIGSGA